MQTRTPSVPAGPAQRVARAAGSLLLLAGLLAGVPATLIALGGNPLPGDLPGAAGVWERLTSPDDGTLFLAGLTVVGWLAWAVFAGSVLLELIARVTRSATPAIPGLRGPQRLAAVLVAAVATVTVTPTVASANAAVVDVSPPSAPAVTAPSDPSAAPPSAGAQREGEPQVVRHLVERGEGLLDLQDRYGVPWQRIAEANYGVEQPDGRSLQRGQTRIYPGWELTIPVAAGPVVTGLGPNEVPGPGGHAGAASASAAQGRYEYVVAPGDWLWHVADRYLGDPERYQDIAALNPQYADEHGGFPDHIEPGWRLRLPTDAVDGGEIPHATGSVTDSDGSADPRRPPDAEQPPGSAAPPEGPGSSAPASPPTVAGFGSADPDAAGVPEGPAPEPEATGLGAAPAGTDAGAGDGAGDTVAGDAGAGDAAAERLAPVALAGAGLLAALVLGSAAALRHQRRQHHRVGFRFDTGPARRLETALRSAQQPLDHARLHAALRQLGGELATREGPLPDIAGALVDDGSVHLLLGAACPGPPEPWRDHGDRWTLPAGADLPAAAGPQRPAPLPALATVGSQAGIHLLLDLERLGVLTVHGDPVRALDLLRYLAAELACNSWSDSAEILVAGFEPYETELLTSVAPERVRVLPSIDAAVAQVRHRVTAARSAPDHTGAPDALAERLRGPTGGARPPQILLAVPSSSADAAELTELAHAPTGAARCAVVVAAPGPAPAGDEPQVSVAADGTLHVRLPFLRASLAVAALPVPELATLAGTMRAARAAPTVPVPPAPEPDPWAVGTDAAGAVRGVGRATVGHPPEPSTAASPRLPTAPAVMLDAAADPRLDEDVRAWFAASPERPRVGILGQVTVEGSGTAPPARRRLHTELIVFLAQRAGRGADETQIDAALWPDGQVSPATRRLTISRARRWLGTAPDGRPWLSEAGPDQTYRLADGVLFDWHLFRRLRTRADLRGSAGAEDLRTALRLVRGAPLAGADRPPAPGVRNPYPWLSESDVHPDHVAASVVDAAHQLARWRLAAGDPAGVRWAVQQAWLADPDRGYDQPWQDLLRAEHADGRTDQLRAVLAELMEARDVESPEDLSPATYRLVSAWPRNVLVPAG